MQSLNLDYLFDKIYDLLLSIKYFWYFTILHKTESEYLELKSGDVWDGLRDRAGWLSGNHSNDVVLNTLKSNINSSVAYGDTLNSASSQALDAEIHSSLGNYDKFKSFIGLSPTDTDGDGLPDSYEIEHGYNPNSYDSDGDGLDDKLELIKHSDPMSADTDGDGVIDGRDFYPDDASRSVSINDQDFDGDGVGDNLELSIGGSNMTSDTDGDGYLDSYDLSINGGNHITSATDSHNAFIHIGNLNLGGVSLEIKNGFILFAAQVLGILYIIAIPMLVYVIYKWYKQITHDVDHYYHMFHDAYGYSEVHGSHHAAEHAGTHNENDMLHKLTQHKIETTRKESVITNEVHHDIEKTVELATSAQVLEIDDEKRAFIEKWQSIEESASSESEDTRRIAIINADNLLDDLLISRGYLGQSLGDRLSNANFKTVDLAFDVHRLRNRIAHSKEGFTLSEREARKAVVTYEMIFKDLNVL